MPITRTFVNFLICLVDLMLQYYLNNAYHVVDHLKLFALESRNYRSTSYATIVVSISSHFYVSLFAPIFRPTIFLQILKKYNYRLMNMILFKIVTFDKRKKKETYHNPIVSILWICIITNN